MLNAAPARPISQNLASVIDILVVNALEAADLCGLSMGRMSNPGEALAVATRLAERFPTVVVTLGGDGLVCAQAGGEPFHLPARRITVASTHGAGDEFIGVLAARLAIGGTMREALEAANAAATRRVETPEKERESTLKAP